MFGSEPAGYIRLADMGQPQAGDHLDDQRGHAPLLIGRFERSQFTDRAPPQNAGQQPQSQYQVAAGPYGGGEDVNQQQIGVHGSVRAGVGTGRSGSSLLPAALRREVILRKHFIEDVLLDEIALPHLDRQAHGQMYLAGHRDLQRHPRLHGRHHQPALIADLAHVPAHQLEVGLAMAIGRFLQCRLGQLPVVLALEGNREDMEVVMGGEALVDHRLGNEQGIGYHYPPSRALVQMLAGADLEDGRGQKGLVDHVTAQVLDLDAIPQNEGARSALENGAGDAQDQFLGGHHEGHGNSDDRQGQGAQLLTPDHHQPEQHQQQEAVARVHQPAAAQLGGLHGTQNEAGGQCPQHHHHDDEYYRTGQEAQYGVGDDKVVRQPVQILKHAWYPCGVASTNDLRS